MLYTREDLDERYDEAKAAGATAIGIDFAAVIGDITSSNYVSLMVFLPLYLVASFLDCRQCHACCKPNSRRWDKGIHLTRKEAGNLSHLCRINKKNGQHVIKYPCPFLQKSGCEQYMRRPLACRLFPFLIDTDKATGEYRHGVITNCPAANELYVKSMLFIQQLALNLKESGRRSFGITDLELAKSGFNHNHVSSEDSDYLRRIAVNPYSVL